MTDNDDVASISAKQEMFADLPCSNNDISLRRRRLSLACAEGLAAPPRYTRSLLPFLLLSVDLDRSQGVAAVAGIYYNPEIDNSCPVQQRRQSVRPLTAQSGSLRPMVAAQAAVWPQRGQG